MDQAAADDAERQRNRARLYAPPRGQHRVSREPSGMTATKARALSAQLAVEDARLAGGRRTGR